jgi:hypothetical protein
MLPKDLILTHQRQLEWAHTQWVGVFDIKSYHCIAESNTDAGSSVGVDNNSNRQCKWYICAKDDWSMHANDERRKER